MDTQYGECTLWPMNFGKNWNFKFVLSHVWHHLWNFWKLISPVNQILAISISTIVPCSRWVFTFQLSQLTMVLIGWDIVANLTRAKTVIEYSQQLSLSLLRDVRKIEFTMWIQVCWIQFYDFWIHFPEFNFYSEFIFLNSSFSEFILSESNFVWFLNSFLLDPIIVVGTRTWSLSL